MTAPVIGVLGLQGDVREHRAALESSGATSTVVRRPEELAQVDALVIPGGESTTIDMLTRVVGLRDPLRSRIAGGMPVYGSCAGMILLADRVLDGHPDQQTLAGLDVTVRRNAFGRQVDSHEGDLEVRGVGGGPVRAVFIRAPWVEEWGDGVEVLAAVEAKGESRPVVVRQGALLATSFHPEVTGDHRLHRLFVGMVTAA
ncbi:pyridoxal 5'-phosphate synthase glutaminase subunit PdxT [Janibacter alittae]|uniref:Pyridoxal 5'-phosphate synthase subunit PdxT n=1 Tax=Janibacter alittae TaxID=3115209 RepID=A0ABZ2MM39_9MICO